MDNETSDSMTYVVMDSIEGACSSIRKSIKGSLASFDAALEKLEHLDGTEIDRLSESLLDLFTSIKSSAASVEFRIQVLDEIIKSVQIITEDSRDEEYENDLPFEESYPSDSLE